MTCMLFSYEYIVGEVGLYVVCKCVHVCTVSNCVGMCVLSRCVSVYMFVRQKVKLR